MVDLGVVILAAGQGTRMNSNTNKVLHTIGGRPMIEHVFEAASAVSDLKPLIVVGPHDEDLHSLFRDRALFAEQAQPLGTGHATKAAAIALEGKCRRVLVTYADMPLLRSETMVALASKQEAAGAVVVLLTVMGDETSTFGRLLRDEMGYVSEIVEVAEAMRRPDAQALLQHSELNAGVYCFAGEWLWDNLDRLPIRRARTGEEYYLTDMIGLAVSQGRTVEAVVSDDPDECLGAGTRLELAVVERAYRRRTNAYWMARGVSMVDPEATYIDHSVTIGQDTTILPNSYLLGSTHIGRDCMIGPNAVIRNARIGDACRIEQAVVENTTLEDSSIVESFNHLRGN